MRNWLSFELKSLQESVYVPCSEKNECSFFVNKSRGGGEGHASATLLGLSDLVPSLSAAVPAHSASQREQSASMQWREPSLFLLFSRLVTGFLQQKIRTLTLFSP